MGSGTDAIGPSSTAMGYYTTASGSHSTAMGFTPPSPWGTVPTAMGYSSTAMGREIQAAGNFSVAIALNDQNGATVSDDNTMAIMGGEVGIGVLSPSHVLHISGAGRSTQAAWDTSSDERVKTEVTELDGTLDKILQLHPVRFEWTEEFRQANPGLSEGDISFLAQEVEKIFPEMVHQVREEIGDETIDDFRVMNSSILFPLLVKAIQEQQATIQDQQLQIEDLVGKVDELNNLTDQLR